MALGVNTTFDIKIGLQVTLDPSITDVYKDLGFYPAAAAQYRYYYNFEKRQKNRRQIYGNSANYVVPAIAVFATGSRTIENELVTGVFGYAGLQRSYDSGFNFSVDVGAAYSLGSFDLGIYPVANLSIGWILSENRWCVGK